MINILQFPQVTVQLKQKKFVYSYLQTFSLQSKPGAINIRISISYDVSSLFTNVPLDETIDILTRKAFENNWVNDTYDLNLT